MLELRFTYEDVLKGISDKEINIKVRNTNDEATEVYIYHQNLIKIAKKNIFKMQRS